MKECILILSLLSTFSQVITAQEIQKDTTASSLVIIDAADTIRAIRRDTSETMLLIGNVKLHQDSLFMECDSARKVANNLFAFGKVILQQWDSLNVFADTLTYFGNTKNAELLGSVILQNKDQKLYTESLSYNTDSKIAIYDEGALLTNDTTKLYSRRGTYYVNLDEIHFKDSIYIEGREFQLYADTLKFQTNLQLATFLGPTVIQLNKESRIYCERGYYDLANNQALFTQNAQYIKDNQEAVADTIYYNSEEETVTLMGHAELIEDSKLAQAETIVYDRESETMILDGAAFFQDSSRTVYSERMIYYVKEDKFVTHARANLVNPPQFLEADSIDFDNVNGFGIAVGNVIWTDTTADYKILCQEAEYTDSLSYIKAYGDRPVMITTKEDDPLYLAADTLISFEKFNDKDTSRVFDAFYSVAILKSNLQARCDSLTYSSEDSIFHLFRDPIIWSDTSQFTADTVRIKLVGSEIKRIFLDQNAFILNSTDEILFNQMKGKKIIAYFEESEINRIDISGNAQSIYYVLDDSGAYLGVNETLCSSMLLHFGQNEVTDIVFYKSPEATFHPIQTAKVEELKLEGFKWRGSERPQSVDDLENLTIQ
ncbi:MAG: hypothetical protein OEQ53_11945 [Saprospiraceae bacterium]|nr:hypothetical protein [Saprospiraceae bacterium]